MELGKQPPSAAVKDKHKIRAPSAPQIWGGGKKKIIGAPQMV